MKLSFATLGCPKWTIEQVAANAAKIGFDGVELRGIAGEHIGPEETPDRRREIRAMFEKAGVRILAIMGYSSFTVEDPKAREDNIRIACQFVQTARDIGCPVLRVFGGKLPEGAGRDAMIARVIEGLKRVGAEAEAAGVSVALETHDDWCVGANLRRVLDGVGSPAVGACWDVANSHFTEPAEQTYAAIGPFVRHVHFKDARRMPDGKVRSILPGQGEVPLQKVLKILHTGGYAATLSFEWEKKWEPELEEPEVAFPHYLRFTRNLMETIGVPRG
jgi:sugar phosphate isomerase/epimerase